MALQTIPHTSRAGFDLPLDVLKDVLREWEVPAGSLRDAEPFAERLETPGPFPEAMGATLRALVQRGGVSLTRMELLDLLCLAVSGKDVEGSGPALRRSVRQMLVFINGVLLSMQEPTENSRRDVSQEATEMKEPSCVCSGADRALDQAMDQGTDRATDREAEQGTEEDTGPGFYVLESFGLVPHTGFAAAPAHAAAPADAAAEAEAAPSAEALGACKAPSAVSWTAASGTGTPWVPAPGSPAPGTPAPGSPAPGTPATWAPEPACLERASEALRERRSERDGAATTTPALTTSPDTGLVPLLQAPHPETNWAQTNWAQTNWPETNRAATKAAETDAEDVWGDEDDPEVDAPRGTTVRRFLSQPALIACAVVVGFAAGMLVPRYRPQTASRSVPNAQADGMRSNIVATGLENGGETIRVAQVLNASTPPGHGLEENGASGKPTSPPVLQAGVLPQARLLPEAGPEAKPEQPRPFAQAAPTASTPLPSAQASAQAAAQSSAHPAQEATAAAPSLGAGLRVPATTFLKAGTGTVATVPPNVALRNLIYSPSPVYPSVARLTHAQGEVTLAIAVSAQGSVIATHVLGGEPLLRGAAENAVLHWRFRPFAANGKPAQIQTAVSVNVRPPL